MTRLEGLVSVREAAAIKGVPEDTVRRRIARGALPAIKVVRVWMIRRKDLDKWLVQKKG